jgi:uncharacterized protein YqgC (DUF456 family)
VPAWGELLVAVCCVVGIVGTVLPVLPGAVIIGAAIVVWAIVEGSLASWVAAVVAVLVLVVGAALTYWIPGRRLSAAGIPAGTLVAGGVLGVVGFFVVPVVGLPIGFVLGIYLAERLRLRSHGAAWPSTVEAMKGAGLSALIGLIAAVTATTVWATVALTT